MALRNRYEHHRRLKIRRSRLSLPDLQGIVAIVFNSHPLMELEPSVTDELDELLRSPSDDDERRERDRLAAEKEHARSGVRLKINDYEVDYPWEYGEFGKVTEPIRSFEIGFGGFGPSFDGLEYSAHPLRSLRWFGAMTYSYNSQDDPSIARAQRIAELVRSTRRNRIWSLPTHHVSCAGRPAPKPSSRERWREFARHPFVYSVIGGAFGVLLGTLLTLWLT